MASGDILNIEVLETFSTKSNPFWSSGILPYSGYYTQLKNFKCLNNNKKLVNTVLGYWEPKRDESEITFPYQNIFDLILHSGTQKLSGSGEQFFATSGDLIGAGFDETLSKKYGYKYTLSGAPIGYNEIYIEGTGTTLQDLLGKTIDCVMVSHFSDSGIVPFNNAFGYKIKNQKTGPGTVRYQFFLSTGEFNFQESTETQKKAYVSIGSAVNTENYLNITGNNENFFIRHSGISGEFLYGTFNISNSGNHTLRYIFTGLDPRITISRMSPKAWHVRGGIINRETKRKRLQNKRTISYKISTIGLNLNHEYTGYIQFSGIYKPDTIYNTTGFNIPIYYKINDHGSRAYFDNFYFKYTGDFHENINAFETYPIGTPIQISKLSNNKYPKLNLGLTVYNTGTGVSGAKSLDKISSGFFKPCLESKMYWNANTRNQLFDSSMIKMNTKNGMVQFRTGISGSLPSNNYINYQSSSGAFQSDILFSIKDTGQISAGLYSGDIYIFTSDTSYENPKSFPVLVNYL